MPQTLYDADGNPIENVPTKEEYDQAQKALEEIKTNLKEKEDALAKYSSKEFNFEALRSASKEGRETLMKDFSEKEKRFVEQIENLQKQVEEHGKTVFSSYEDEILTALAGQDKEKREKIKEAAKTFIGEAKTKDELMIRMKNAAKLVGGTTEIDPLHAFVPSSGYSEVKGKRYTDTEEGKANLKKWFPQIYKDQK